MLIFKKNLTSYRLIFFYFCLARYANNMMEDMKAEKKAQVNNVYQAWIDNLPNKNNHFNFKPLKKVL